MRALLKRSLCLIFSCLPVLAQTKELKTGTTVYVAQQKYTLISVDGDTAIIENSKGKSQVISARLLAYTDNVEAFGLKPNQELYFNKEPHKIVAIYPSQRFGVITTQPTYVVQSLKNPNKISHAEFEDFYFTTLERNGLKVGDSVFNISGEHKVVAFKDDPGSPFARMLIEHTESKKVTPTTYLEVANKNIETNNIKAGDTVQVGKEIMSVEGVYPSYNTPKAHIYSKLLLRDKNGKLYIPNQYLKVSKIDTQSSSKACKEALQKARL